MTKKSQPETQDATSKIETVFAYIAVGLIGTSVLVMLATLIIAATGTATPSVGKVVVPPIMIFYPQFGLAAGALDGTTRDAIDRGAGGGGLYDADDELCIAEHV